MLGVVLVFAAVVWCAFVVFVGTMPPGTKIIAAGSAFVIYPVFYARLWFMLRVQTLWAKQIAAGRITLGGVHPDVLVRLARP